VARAVLGVAVQRQVGEDDAEAVDEVLHDGLELAVREERGVQEDEARAGPGLPVGDPGAVGRVVEAEPHPGPGGATGRGTGAGAAGGDTVAGSSAGGDTMAGSSTGGDTMAGS
jgi:hypothetical protein